MNGGRVISALRSLGHTLAALTTHCRDFKQAWKSSGDHVKGSLAGRWEGEWVSQHNGHHGALRCAIVHMSQGRYRARFHARYSKFLRVCYCVELQSEGAALPVRLRGEADLGRLGGGVYSYDGQSDGEELICQYRCRYDHGTFNLRRLSRPDKAVSSSHALPAH